jgi:hypothetical protein
LGGKALSALFLTDFSLRLACGLVAWSAVINWRTIPVAFFRTQCLVALGLYVLGMLAGWGSFQGIIVKTAWLALAVLAYSGTVAWGIGLPKIGRGLCAVMALVSISLMVLSGHADGGIFEALARVASSLWLGATLTAMLLGHYYLTAPAMSIDPLLVLVRGMFLFFGIRLATTLLPVIFASSSGIDFSDGAIMMWFAMRVLMGYVGVLAATWLAWRTALIRSTQSATGILYIALALLLFGELTSMLLGRSSHITI